MHYKDSGPLFLLHREAKCITFFFKQLEGHVKDTDKNVWALQIHISTTSMKMHQKLRIL